MCTLIERGESTQLLGNPNCLVVFTTLLSGGRARCEPVDHLETMARTGQLGPVVNDPRQQRISIGTPVARGVHPDVISHQPDVQTGRLDVPPRRTP